MYLNLCSGFTKQPYFTIDFLNLVPIYYCFPSFNLSNHCLFARNQSRNIFTPSSILTFGAYIREGLLDIARLHRSHSSDGLLPQIILDQLDEFNRTNRIISP